MDEASFEQVELPQSLIKDELPYIKEDTLVNILFWENQPLSVEIPPKVPLQCIVPVLFKRVFIRWS